MQSRSRAYRTHGRLQANEDYYRALLSLSPDGISVVDQTGHILTCNERFAQIHGYDHSGELIGRHAAEFAPPEVYARLFREVAAAFAAGRSVVRGIEVEAFKRDGATVATEYSITQVPWPDAAAGVAFVSNVRDITKHKQMVAELEHHQANLEKQVQERTADLQAEIAQRALAQAALERAEKSLNEAERIAHVGSWEWDLATDAQYASDEFCRIFGLHPDDRGSPQGWRPGRPCIRRIHRRGGCLCRRAAGQARRSTRPYRIICLRARCAWCAGRAEVIQDAARSSIRVHGMVQDITDQARVREALDQRARELASLQALSYQVSLSFAQEDLIQVVLEKIIAVADLDMARLFLLKEGSLHLVGVRARGTALASPDLTCALGECLCGQAALDGQPIVSGDIYHDARCTRGSCKAYGLNSVAVLPLRSRDQVIGVLALGSLARDALAGRLAFLEMAAEQVAIGLQNALLHQEIQARAAGLEEAVAERTRELQTERDRTQAILETVSESVVVTDLDGQVLFINPSTEALTGFSRDEVLRQPLWGSWSTPVLSATWPEVQQVLRGGQAWRGEIVGHRKDGTLYTAEVTGTPLYDASADPVPVGGVWVQRDITALKEAERLKDQFVSNVSHELRTPVSVIALSCDNLLTFYHRLDDNQRRQMLQDVHEQAHLLNKLVEEILMISQIDGGRTSERSRPVDLAHLVRQEAERQRLIVEHRAQHLTVSARAPVRVMGNEVQLRQVMRNLLENATKYTPVGGEIACTCEIRAAAPAAARYASPASTVSLAGLDTGAHGLQASLGGTGDEETESGQSGQSGESASRFPRADAHDGCAATADENVGRVANLSYKPIFDAESWAVVEVVDNGIGIAAESLPFVFERFYRVDAENDVPGTGLGLPIARELVLLHGGRITVASTPGRGSTFTVYLPVAD